MSIQEEIQQLQTTLEQHNYNYYVLDKPTISDYDFDVLLKRLQELEQQYRLANKPNNTIASLRILERIRTLSKPVELSGKSRR